MPHILQSQTDQLSTILGLPTEAAIIFAILLPIILTVVQHFIERGFDSGQDARIARLQSELDATQKQLQAQLDLRTHITRAQFDVEFSAYQAIWQSLVPLRLATIGLGTVDPDAPNFEEEKDEKYRKFADAIEGFSTELENSRPFYSKAVYDKLMTIFLVCTKQGRAFRVLDAEGSVYKEFAQTTVSELFKEAAEVSEAIRDRLGSVIIIS